MHSLLFAAQSGWGKSYLLQCVVEKNLEKYARVLLLDYKDEYRGLVSKAHGPGPCRHWLAGPHEHRRFGVDEWTAMLQANPKLVVARSGLQPPAWREVCDRAIRAARALGDVLVVIDEAHFVAPQQGSVPDGVLGLSTTGRGEGASSAFVTQRPARLSKDVVGNCTARFLGGFSVGNDLSAISGVVEYPVDLHKSGGHPVAGVPDALRVDGEGLSVRKWSEGDRVTGSEWIYSNSDGEVRRINSSDAYSPACEHVGASGKAIEV